MAMTNDTITQHFVLNAILFVLAGVRYFWGSPNDMLRLGLFLVTGWVVIGDMDYYYDWPLRLPAFGFGPRELITKFLLIGAFLVDLGKDYFTMKFHRRLRELHSFIKETRA